MPKKDEIKKHKLNYINIGLLIATIIMLLVFHFVNLIPSAYFIMIIIVVIFLDFILIKGMKSKGHIKNISKIISILVIILMLTLSLFGAQILDFLKNLNGEYKEINYVVVVLKDSDYTKLKELNDENIGILNTTNDSYKEATDKLSKKIDYHAIDCPNYSDMINDLLNEEVEAIFIEESKSNILKEENSEYNEKSKVIETITIKVKLKDIAKKVDVTKESFNVYISGIDTYGSIDKVSRSDVNIIATINPNTHEIRFTSIPRDYYIKLSSYEEYDKLTHAGIYGIEESVESLEDLLNIDINYYVKVNFTSLIDIVDEIGPITINSKYTFTTGIYDEYTEPYTFYEGENTLNGHEALAFSRERKAFLLGDRTRVENQQIVLKAIVEKLIQPKVLTKYKSLLNTLGENIVTNLDDKEITSFIKKQISEDEDWIITNYVLEGTDSMNYTYSFNGYKLYVMEPDYDSVNDAINDIKKIMNNK